MPKSRRIWVPFSSFSPSFLSLLSEALLGSTGESFALSTCAFLPTLHSKSKVRGGSPRQTERIWWKPLSCSCLSARSSSRDLPAAYAARSSPALFLNRRSMRSSICVEFLEQAVSGMASLGTRPYFSTKLMANE